MLSSQEDAPRLVTPCSIQAEAHMMADRAGWAARAYARYDRAAVVRIARAVADAAYAAAQRYAEWAVRETGMGVAEHKRLKNEVSSRGVIDFYQEMDLVSAKVDPMRKIVEIPKPAGVIFALTPVTNPVATLYYKTLIALLSRNAILFSPHPMAKGCCRDAAELLEAAALKAGAPAGLIQCLAQPSVPLVHALMASPKIAVILATGGGAMVRAAYSSGTPAIGVGPGNVPAYIDPSADQAKAARTLIDSKNFDCSILCTNESVAITLQENRHAFERALRSAGAWICTPQETQRLRDWLFSSGHLKTAAIGKSAAWIAQQIGIRAVSSTRALVAPIERVGVDELLSQEKLCPVLGLIAVDGFERAIATAQMMLRMQGGGHSAAFHGNMPQRAIDYASRLNVYRVVVNAPCSQGASGFATHLAPSFTIGTGYFGRASIGENIGPQHLVHWTRLAWNSDPSEVFADLSSVQPPFEGPVENSALPAVPPRLASASASEIDRDSLRRMILEELRAFNRGLS